MTEGAHGARAVAAFEIDDVALIESECKVARDFNPSEPWGDQAVFAHRVNVEPNVLVQMRTAPGVDPFNVVRYFFNIQVRLLKSQLQPPTDPESVAEDQILATLRFLLAIDYRAGNLSSDPDATGAFSHNAQFHAWPYVREEIHAMCSRLRIPRLTVPMLKTQQRPDGVGHSLAASGPVDAGSEKHAQISHT